MMNAVKIQVADDHLERLANRKNPVQAVSEMIWNGLDGDASNVEVKIVENQLHGIEEIQVIDDGHGIPHELALTSFKSLGASWKKGSFSQDGRNLHGQAGEGRFSAYSLGTHVSWITNYEDTDQLYTYKITGVDTELDTFHMAEPVPQNNGKKTGTKVIMRNLRKVPKSLIRDDAPIKFTEVFALYLRQYPTVRINYNGTYLDPRTVQEHVQDYELEPLQTEEGKTFPVHMTIIEWKHKVERTLAFCDEAGFTLHSIAPGIQARGFDFTVYLKTQYFRELHDENKLMLEEMIPDCNRLVEMAKDKMRAHFRQRLAQDAQNVVEQWKSDEIYPYDGQPRDIVEETERQVFDVVALNINEYLPDFATSDTKSKKFSLHMLKATIEKSPAEARRIVQHVLDLPHDKQKELSNLLEKTSLESIINASKLIVDRLEFLAGLEKIIFSEKGKKHTKERAHLQHIIANNTWIFGEEFHLSVDDQSLTEVLRKHLKLLRKERTELAPVKTLDDETGIVDLMLSKKILQANPKQIEHLVVELKRPSKKIDSDVTTQIKKYAFAVAADERFKDTNTRWVFWAISNDMTDYTRKEITNQANRPDGTLIQAEDMNMTIWVKTWSQVIEACRARLSFFQEKLNYKATHEGGLDHIRDLYSKYLPEALQEDGKSEAT